MMGNDDKRKNTDGDHGRLKIEDRCGSWMTRNELVGYLFSSGKLDPFIYLFQELLSAVCFVDGGICQDYYRPYLQAPVFFLVLK